MELMPHLKPLVPWPKSISSHRLVPWDNVMISGEGSDRFLGILLDYDFLRQNLLKVQKNEIFLGFSNMFELFWDVVEAVFLFTSNTFIFKHVA